MAAAQTAGGASARHRQSTNYVPPPPPHNVPRTEKGNARHLGDHVVFVFVREVAWFVDAVRDGVRIVRARRLDLVGEIPLEDLDDGLIRRATTM